MKRSSTYTFNKHLIKHRFCATCGIHPYGEGVDPKGGALKASIFRLSRFKTTMVARYKGIAHEP